MADQVCFNLPRRNLFKVLEDNPTPEPEDTPRGGDCSVGSTTDPENRDPEGSEAGDTLEQEGAGDRCCATSMSAVTSDSDSDSDTDTDTDTGPGIGIGIAIGIDIGIGIGIDIGIGIGIDIGIGIGIGTGTDIGIDIGIGVGPGVFEVEPEGLAVPCR